MYYLNPGKAAFAIIIAFFVSVALVQASWRDLLGLGSNQATNPVASSAAGLNALSQDQVVQGLKEALGQGVRVAVSQLGHSDGFLTNLNVKIPMPEKLQSVEKTLRALKQDKLADDFIATMNHAAEEAVPAAAGVFSDSIKRMSIADAKAILTGPKDAATQYFRKTTQTNLFEKFLPIVKSATDKAGVTASYKRFVTSASSSKYLGSFGSSLFTPESMDIDAYVTHKALDGLFQVVAEQEKRIRENPVARTSDLLQQVFGAVSK